MTKINCPNDGCRFRNCYGLCTSDEITIQPSFGCCDAPDVKERKYKVSKNENGNFCIRLIEEYENTKEQKYKWVRNAYGTYSLEIIEDCKKDETEI